MAALSPILRNSEDNGLIFWCPGCNMAHGIHHGAGSGPRWGWNRDVNKPTFTPSVLVQTTGAPEGRDMMTPAEEDEYDAIYKAGGTQAVFASRFGIRCHSYVTEGRIQFLSDCTHALAGQTVDLPPFPKRD